MQVGDIAYMSHSMINMGYPYFGIVTDIKGGRFIIYFHSGFKQVFDPRWVLNKPKKEKK